MNDDRDYLKEAQAILHRDRECVLLPERAHLEALDEHYQSLLCGIAGTLEALKREVLNA